MTTVWYAYKATYRVHEPHSEASFTFIAEDIESACKAAYKFSEKEEMWMISIAEVDWNLVKFSN